MQLLRGPALALVAVLLLTMGSTGCIDTDVARQIMDKFIPEPEQKWCKDILLRAEGIFAPDPDQDDQEILDAATSILTDPLSAPEELANLSWKSYSYTFKVPADSRPMLVTFEIDWHFLNNANRIGGTYNIDVKDPQGDNQGHDGKTVQPNPLATEDRVDKVVQLVMVDPVEGDWTVELSGSGFDGVLANTYRGDFDLLVTATVPWGDEACPTI